MEENLNKDNNDNTQETIDELENSPLLSEVLGDALDKCKMFHVKLQKRGLAERISWT